MCKTMLSAFLFSFLGLQIACSKTDFAQQNKEKENESDIERDKDISRNGSSTSKSDDSEDGVDADDNSDGDNKSDDKDDGSDGNGKDTDEGIEGDDSSVKGSESSDVNIEDNELTLRSCNSAEADAVWFQKGVEHARGCWYLGYTGESCDTVCVKHGGIDTHYVSYAGSGGTDQKCLALADAFEKKVPSAPTRLYFSDRTFSAEEGGLGCGVMPRNLASEYDPKFGQMVARVIGSKTSSDAKRSGFARFCSCKK
jgi:hypothetical protein